MNAVDRLSGRQVLLGVTGGIAAYKACELVRHLVTAGAQVQVLMTPRATQFVGPLTFEALSGRPVVVSEFGSSARRTAHGTEHIRLARWGHVLVVAPATAATISRLASGAASDLLSTVALAFRGPVIVAPAMNTAMLEHPATRANLDRLATWGHVIVPPRESQLACGEVGAGALADPAALVAAIAGAVDAGRALDGRKVLITAGPTREPIDPVRYISNGSSGRMGVALAVEAHRRGAAVTLVHGPLAAAVPPGIEAVSATTVAAMLDVVLSRLDGADVLIAAAAPADYVPVSVSPQKIKKETTGRRLVLELVRAPDILEQVARRRRPGQVRVGFALETADLIARAREKLVAKKLDLIVANDAGAMGAPFARIVILDARGTEEEVRGAKGELARAILDKVQERLEAVQ